MSLIQFLRIIWARRWLIAAATVSCVVGAFIVTLILPARWDAHSRVMLNLLKPDPVTGEIIASGATNSYVSTQIELIKDYAVAGQVADQLGLLSDPDMISRYNSRSSSDTRDFRRWLAQFIIDRTKAEVVQGSNILEITYTGETPEIAKAVADSLRKSYLDTSLYLRRSDALRSAEWFDQQAIKAKASLDAAEATVSDYERANGVFMANDTTDVESARLATLAGTNGGTGGAADGSSQLAEVSAEIAQASQTLGPNHPALIALRAKRTALLATMSPGQAGGASNPVQAQAAIVLAKSAKIERLKQLQAEVTIRRDLFNKTSAHAAELRQQAAVADTGLTALGAAVVPQSPTFPNMLLIIPGSLALGLAMGILVGLLTELLNRRVRGPEDLQTALDVPLLAVVYSPH